ncbi:hypothetical protein N199_07335 [Helicobacter pylori UM038]|uniref:Uncharacterized protein n=1 Tax=Helicobacter pylori UM038 TaxID=1352343 RepID=A0AAV3JQL6_HELPX|nr:hypothetical protein N199_07335 [Helicobacter pylori UM038]
MACFFQDLFNCNCKKCFEYFLNKMRNKIKFFERFLRIKVKFLKRFKKSF